MAQNQNKIEIDETLVRTGDDVVEARFKYKVPGDSGTVVYQVSVTRLDYERLAPTIKKPIFPFEKFVRVLRPFIMADKAGHKDVEEAFDLLDHDNSRKIDINQLAAYMPIIVPNGTPSMLLDNIQKLEKKLGYKRDDKLDSTKFIKFIGDAGLGRDTILKCLQN